MPAVTSKMKEDTTQEKRTSTPNAAPQKLNQKGEQPVSSPLELLRRQTNFALFRFLISLCLTLLLFGNMLFPAIAADLPYGKIFPLLPPALLARPSEYASAAVALFLMMLNLPLYHRGLSRILRGVPNTDSLVAVSTLAAFGYSVTALCLTDPDLVGGGPATYFLPLSLTLTLTTMGEYALRRAQRNGFEALAKLNALSPDPSPLPPSSAHATVPGHIALLAIFIAIAAGLLWMGLDSFAVGATVFFTVLIAACPLSIGLVEAVGMSAAMNKAQHSGLLVRDEATWETAADINTVVIGKTGFLTAGTPRITDLVGEGLTDDTLIGLAASAEAKSYHPLAETIANRAIQVRARLQRLAAANEIPGVGVETLINGTAVRVGKRRWLEEEHIYISAGLLTKADQFEERGKTVLFVSSGRSAKGIIAFEDEVRPEMPAMLKALKTMGIQIVLLTGDSHRTAKTFARELDIPEIRADIPTAEKAKELQILQARGLTVAFFDRAITDDAARQADLSVTLTAAFSSSSEKSATLFFASKNFMALPRFLALSRRMMTVLRQNYIWSFAGTLLALPAATGLLYSFGGPLFTPLMALSASLPGLFAIFINAFRLHRFEE